MNKKIQNVVLAAATALLATTLAQAQLISDDFAYPAGALNNQSGGTGWASAWNNNGSSHTLVSPPALAYASGGYSIVQAPSASVFYCNLGSQGYPGSYRGNIRTNSGTTGSVVWFSCLMEDTANNAEVFIGFNSTTPPNPYAPSITYSIGLSNTTLFASWGGALTIDGAPVNTNLALNTVHLVLGCITFQASGANDKLQVWADPPDLTHLGSPNFQETAHDIGANLSNIEVGGLTTSGVASTAFGSCAYVGALRFSDGNGDTNQAYTDVTGTTNLGAAQAPVAVGLIANPGVPLIYPGTPVTLNENAGGTPPLYYQWYANNGTGTPVPVGGWTTNFNLAVNTTGFTTPGAYEYQVMVSNSVGTSLSAVLTLNFISSATVAMTDLGSEAAPTPGANDQYQLSGPEWKTDGFSLGAPVGQTFTTGSNPGGYVLNTLAFETEGGNLDFPTINSYMLRIYSITGAGGTTANLLAAYNAQGGGTEFDWFEWTGLNTLLSPNTMYAYVFAPDLTNNFAWEKMSSIYNNPYPNGQLCQIPAAGGAVTYGGTGTADMTFDIGLNIPTTPVTTVPTYAPVLATLYAGTPVTLSELAGGSATMNYEWQWDNGTSGTTWTTLGSGFTTSSNYTLTSGQDGSLAGAYEFQCVVSNSLGTATSAVLTVTFVSASAPISSTGVTPQPYNYAYIGQSGVTFRGTFVGTLPMTYQWVQDPGTGPTNITGATNNTLVLNNVQLTNAGTYSLNAYNSVGGSTPTPSSYSSTLVVTADPGAPAAGTYAAAVLANSPVAFWPLNDTNDPSSGAAPAYDASGHNYDGTYGIYSQNGFNTIASGDTNTIGPESPAFPGFPSVNYALYSGMTSGAGQPSYVTVPPLNLPGNSMTITAWINIPTALIGGQNNAGIFVYANGLDFAGLCLSKTLSNGMFNLGYSWNQGNSATWAWDSGLFPTLGQWQFVALVIDPSNTTVYLGTNSATNVLANDSENFGVGGITEIGGGGLANYPNFPGSIADVAVYNKELTTNQLAALYDVGVGIYVAPPVPTLSIAKSGANVTLTWSAGSLLQATSLAGPWTTNTSATSPYTITPGGTKMFYQAVVQ